MKRPFFFGLLLLTLGGIAGVALAATVTTTAQLSITITNPLIVSFSPAAPSVGCTAAAGTVVATATVSGGDGNPITMTALTGDTVDFALGIPSGNSWPIVVGPGGISAGHCPVAPAVTTTQVVNVSPTQP